MCLKLFTNVFDSLLSIVQTDCLSKIDINHYIVKTIENALCKTSRADYIYIYIYALFNVDFEFATNNNTNQGTSLDVGCSLRVGGFEPLWDIGSLHPPARNMPDIPEELAVPPLFSDGRNWACWHPRQGAEARDSMQTKHAWAYVQYAMQHLRE